MSNGKPTHELVTVSEAESDSDLWECCRGCICDDGTSNYCNVTQYSMGIDCEEEAVIFKLAPVGTRSASMGSKIQEIK